MISVITRLNSSAKRYQRTEEREKIASLMSVFRKVELDNEIAKLLPNLEENTELAYWILSSPPLPIERTVRFSPKIPKTLEGSKK